MPRAMCRNAAKSIFLPSGKVVSTPSHTAPGAWVRQGPDLFLSQLGNRTQYVARPPDRSKQKPVLKLFSGETMNSAIAANSAVAPHRFIGILSVM